MTQKREFREKNPYHFQNELIENGRGRDFGQTALRRYENLSARTFDEAGSDVNGGFDRIARAVSRP